MLTNNVSIQIILIALASAFTYILINTWLRRLGSSDWTYKNMLLLFFIASTIGAMWSFLPYTQILIVMLAASAVSYWIIQSNIVKSETYIKKQQEYHEKIPKENQNLVPAQKENSQVSNYQIINQDKRYSQIEFLREASKQNITLSSSLISQLKDFQIKSDKIRGFEPNKKKFHS
ncbi:hypothetical protein [Thermosinus carboxydivorans]|uniref:hypothetical protein n=1 Tax=Thermosinus carboxydivorans TaxID=261685 RepID=UPI0005930C55|nr:hypothetical protein [Thermosinus carboxydivorans]